MLKCAIILPCKGVSLIMNILKAILFFSMNLILVLPARGQDKNEEFKKNVDEIVAAAYKEASAKFPCRLRTSGKVRMGDWRDVEQCVNPAHDLVDWEGHAIALRKIREDARVSHEDLTAAIEASLTKHAILYDSVFQVREREAGTAILPLSNSLLKFLPENSLAELPVYSKEGDRIGSFMGTYPFERSGGLTVLGEYRRMNFQYTDLNGNAQAPTQLFLVDSFGVPWRDARLQLGFRLPSNKLLNWR